MTQGSSAPKTIKIDDKFYDVSSLTEKGSTIISNIHRVDESIYRHELDLGIIKLAKYKLLEELANEVQHFTEVEINVKDKESSDDKKGQQTQPAQEKET